MNQKKILVLSVLALFTSIFVLSCSDAGILIPRNDVNFTTTLKPLNPQADGLYEAWISFNILDQPDSSYMSLGKFNVSSAGGIVDSNGTPVALKLRYHPAAITSAYDAIITLESPGDHDTIPSQVRVMGGLVTQDDQFLNATLTMNYIGAVGNVINDIGNAQARFILNTPTAIDSFYKGIWFCDTLQNALLTLPLLSDSLPWTYEAWIRVVTDSSYIKVGRFSNPGLLDDDWGGPYAGILPPYLKPGQDWIIAGSPITNLRANFYQVIITLEPKNESALAMTIPFGAEIFYMHHIEPAITRGQISAFLDNHVSTLPTATMQVGKQ